MRLCRILISLLVIFSLQAIQAGTDAGRGAPFTAGAGARALGLGGGFVALADDASAVYYNPAGLARLEWQEATFMHMTLFEGTIYDYAGWTVPTLRWGAVGLAYMRLGTDDIIRREGFRQLGSFDYSYSQFLISYARNLSGNIAVGLSGKIVNQSLDTKSDYGFGLDVGLISHIYKKLRGGVSVHDIVPAKLRLDQAEEKQPLSLNFGLAIERIYLSDHASLTTTFEIEKEEYRSAKIHSGAELILNQRFFLRTGYDRDNGTFGAGCRWGRLAIDYAYRIMDYINDSHRFSLTYQIGVPVSERRILSEKAEEKRGSDLLESERRRRFVIYKRKAEQFRAEQQLDSARAYYERALAFDESNPEILDALVVIDGQMQGGQHTIDTVRISTQDSWMAVETYYNQAENFFSKEYYPAALDMLQLVLDIDPGHQRAEKLRDRILSVMSEEIDRNLRMGREAQMVADYASAIEHYSRVLYLDPENTQVKNARKQVLAKMDVARQLNLGIEDFRAGRYSQARKRFTAVQEIAPDEPISTDYLKRLATIPTKAPTLDDIQKDRKIWQLYLDGLRLMREQDYEKAIAVWEKVLKVYPNNPNTLNNIEQAKLRLNPETSGKK